MGISIFFFEQDSLSFSLKLLEISTSFQALGLKQSFHHPSYKFDNASQHIHRFGKTLDGIGQHFDKIGQSFDHFGKHVNRFDKNVDHLMRRSKC